MDPRDRLIKLREKLGYSKAAFARILGVSATSYGDIENKNGILRPEYIQKIQKETNTDIRWLICGEGSMFANEAGTPSNIIEVPVIDVQAAAGYGAKNYHEEVLGHISFEKCYLKNELGAQTNTLNIISVTGDSMKPTLESGDMIMLDKSKNIPKSGGIYVIRQYDEVIVKRIQLLPGHQLHIYSDNSQNYPPFTVDMAKYTDDFTIIGKVLWHARKLT